MSAKAEKTRSDERRQQATKLVACKRTEQVLAIRLDGAEFWDVRDFVREAEKQEDSPWYIAPGVKPMSDTQIWRYIKKADELLKATHERSRNKTLRRHLAQRRRLYARAVAAGDVRTALAVLRDEAVMLGLYPDPDAEALKDIGKLKEEINKASDQEADTGTAAETDADQDSPEHGTLPQ